MQLLCEMSMNILATSCNFLNYLCDIVFIEYIAIQSLETEFDFDAGNYFIIN